MNWGTGIAIAYGIFAISMVGVVVASTRHNPGLVQKNYYDLDIHYQKRLDGKHNTAALAALPTATYVTERKEISVMLPEGMATAHGQVKYYRAAQIDDDFAKNFENTTHIVSDASQLTPGRWHIEVEWEVEGKPYFWETVVFVNNV